MVLSPVLHRNNSFLSLPLYCLVTDRPAVLARPLRFMKSRAAIWQCFLSLPVSVHLHLLSREPEALQNRRAAAFDGTRNPMGMEKLEPILLLMAFNGGSKEE